MIVPIVNKCEASFLPHDNVFAGILTLKTKTENVWSLSTDLLITPRKSSERLNSRILFFILASSDMSLALSAAAQVGHISALQSSQCHRSPF